MKQKPLLFTSMFATRIQLFSFFNVDPLIHHLMLCVCVCGCTRLCKQTTLLIEKDNFHFFPITLQERVMQMPQCLLHIQLEQNKQAAG